MDPGFRINNTLKFSYKQLKKKASKFAKFPRHKRSSQLCLIAAERDSLKDLNSQVISYSLDSKGSKAIQILNFPNESEFPIEYKNSPDKPPKELSLKKIVINKSSRIKDGDSPKKVAKSEVFPNNRQEPKMYWTKKRQKPKEEPEANHESTLEKSREIEVSYFPTNQQGTSIVDVDSFLKKRQSTEKREKRRSLESVKGGKTSLSEQSQGSDQMIQDFLDRQVKKDLNQKEECFEIKDEPDSVTLSMEDATSQNVCSLKQFDEKKCTGFTFNIFKNKNIVKSEIFDTSNHPILFSNFESERHDPSLKSYGLIGDMKKKPKKKGKAKENRISRTPKASTISKNKLVKTPVREKHVRNKIKTQIFDAKRSTKSHTKAGKKKAKKKLAIARNSVNFVPQKSLKGAKLKINKKKKSDIKKKSLAILEHQKTVPANSFKIKNLTSSRHFKQSRRHKRTLSGLEGMMDKFGLTTAKQKSISKMSRKEPKKIQTNPKKTLRINLKAKERIKIKKTKMAETPIYKESLTRLTFNQKG